MDRETGRGLKPVKPPVRMNFPKQHKAVKHKLLMKRPVKSVSARRAGHHFRSPPKENGSRMSSSDMNRRDTQGTPGEAIIFKDSLAMRNAGFFHAADGRGTVEPLQEHLQSPSVR